MDLRKLRFDAREISHGQFLATKAGLDHKRKLNAITPRGRPSWSDVCFKRIKFHVSVYIAYQSRMIYYNASYLHSILPCPVFLIYRPIPS
jgi:hypothetical protein